MDYVPLAIDLRNIMEYDGSLRLLTSMLSFAEGEVAARVWAGLLSHRAEYQDWSCAG
jgi:hypothetical protein